MSTPVITLTSLGGSGPVLLVGPSLGTRSTTLWAPCAQRLADRFHVLAWDLPGHGDSPAASGFTIADLAQAALTSLADTQMFDGTDVYAAGDSLGGAVTLQLALDAPERISGVVIACSGPKIGTAQSWGQRAADVRAGGLEPAGAVRTATPARWFGPGFADRAPNLTRQLLDELSSTDPESYVACCEALAGFDLRDRLAEIVVPVLAVAGSVDQVTPTALLRQLANGVQHGRLVELPGVSHLAPAEAPEQLASLIADHATRTPASSTAQQVRAQGMRVRRQVLGNEHVDRAGAGVTDFTADFQEFITQYAWGTIWTRPGLDRRSRSIAVLTALVARGHHAELAMHVRAALRNGLTADEIKEVLLQSAIYCGVPDANTAFRIAGQVLAEES